MEKMLVLLSNSIQNSYQNLNTVFINLLISSDVLINASLTCNAAEGSETKS